MSEFKLDKEELGALILGLGEYLEGEMWREDGHDADDLLRLSDKLKRRANELGQQPPWAVDEPDPFGLEEDNDD
jgi:hypothetical protein